MFLKKTTACILTAAVIIFVFAGCESKKSVNETLDTSTTTTTVTTTTKIETTSRTTVTEQPAETTKIPDDERVLTEPLEWYNSLKPDGHAGEELVIVKERKSSYIIAVPENHEDSDMSAARELQDWIRKMTGVSLSITSEAKVTDDTQGIISIGRTELLEETFPEMASQEIKYDGWGVASDKKNLFLWGDEGRGTVNAVFAFLEEELGFRWYSRHNFRTPKSDTLIVSVVNRVHSPPFRYRDPFYNGAFNIKWSTYNRTNANFAPVPEQYGGHIDYGSNTRFGEAGRMIAHTFHDFIPPDKYFKDHPEYFMMERNGRRNPQQLCMTNPDVINLMIENVKIFLTESPHTEIVSVSKNDYVLSCVCETCKPLDDKEGTNMASLLYLVNSVADAIKDDFPDVFVSTLAYLETIDLPKTIRPAKNVIIRICNDAAGSWVSPFTPAKELKFGRLLEEWSNVHENMFVWDYVINFSHFMAPMPNIHVIADNLKYYADTGVSGVLMQGNMMGNGSEREELRIWMMSKLMLYPDMDVDELVYDFVSGYFGQASGAIYKYYKLLEEQGEVFYYFLKTPSGGIRYRMDNQFLSRFFIREAQDLFDEALVLAENNDILQRVQREMLPIMYVMLERGPLFTGREYQKILNDFINYSSAINVKYLNEGIEDYLAMITRWQKSYDDFYGK